MSELFVIRVGYGEIQIVLGNTSEEALEKVSAGKFQEPEIIAVESNLKDTLSEPHIERVLA
jgi:hypothetical protein